MKTKLLNFKNFKKIIFIIFLNLSLSTFAINSIELENNDNAVNLITSGTSNGVDTYKTFTVTIPFYSDFLLNSSFRSDYVSSGCSTNRIRVNGVYSSYISSNPTQPVLFKWFNLPNLAPGIYYYTVQTYCGSSGTQEVPNSKQLIKLVIIKELAPQLTLNVSKECAVNNQTGLYNGYLNLKISGSYTNASKLYIAVYHGSNTCPNGQLTKLTTLSNNSNLPNNTLNNSVFFNCNSNTTYTVKLYYKSTNIFGNIFIQEIPNGAYGWNNYSFTKSFRTCMNVLEPAPDKELFLRNDNSNETEQININNPTKDFLNINLNNKISNYEIIIYDYSGLIVKKENKLNSDQSKNKIFVEDLKKGIYLVEIKYNDKTYRTKMIKE